MTATYNNIRNGKICASWNIYAMLPKFVDAPDTPTLNLLFIMFTLDIPITFII